MKRVLMLIPVLWMLGGCATMAPVAGTPGPDSELALVRKLIEDAHGSRDSSALGMLYASQATYEWRGRALTLSGREALARHLQERWADQRELRLNLSVDDLHVHGDRAYEFGTYEETWIDARSTRVTEFGRYVTAYVRDADRRWRVERMLGYSNLVAKKLAAD